MLGIPLNGALHWLVYDFVGPNRVIAAFDLVEEKFKTLPLPDIMITTVTFFRGYLLKVLSHPTTEMISQMKKNYWNIGCSSTRATEG
ncbi:hypothetical protein JRO89_XS06G0168400 [Xanthoceras sorbifolium]|uniref:Uncharacterized protein n=1 Tax=Xanthoceras sorbifolium TaxID=99658 RepID=A0ABQ8HYM9_9ROSI|nr:hypothetical protein JRO89_XS06G0168400 [Xanthoceras sorbifolium]